MKVAMLKESKSVKETMNTFLVNLLNTGIVDYVLIPLQHSKKESVFPTLTKNKTVIMNADPIAPVLPVSTATQLVNFTRLEKSPKKVAVVMKPCEIRTTIELTKLRQISLDNILLIGVDCVGTYPITYYKESKNSGNDLESDLFNLAKDGAIDNNFRNVCKICRDPEPHYADIILGYIGLDGKVIAKGITEKGVSALTQMGLNLAENEPKERTDAVSRLKNKKLGLREKFIADAQKELYGVDGLQKFFSSCIDCHNCMNQCPICFCKECFFESIAFEKSAREYLRLTDKKETGLMMPTDKIQFHLGRLSHMATSCVGCGLCEQACPADIPLYKLFGIVSHFVQAVFNYEAGRSLDEPPPLMTFKESELEEFVGKRE